MIILPMHIRVCLVVSHNKDSTEQIYIASTLSAGLVHEASQIYNAVQSWSLVLF